MDIIEYLHMSPIELLGYSKNNIMEVKEKTEGIPQTYIDKLDQAYTLIDEVQKYLYVY